jgi:hypothetical protein
MLNPAAVSSIYARMFDAYAHEIEIQSLDNTVSPPIWTKVKNAKAVVQSYTPQELLSGAIPENSHRVLILNRDLGDYQIKIKSDRLIINGKPYVPQAVNALARGSSDAYYATEVRVIG